MRRVLIANRGEIAVRIARSAREMGIESVAVYSEADQEAEHVRAADHAVAIGPPPAGASYLNVEAILDAVRASGADAVHPGYGFLSENAAFADAVVDAGATWVGPSPDAIRQMGDKAVARRHAERAGVSGVPGSDGVVTDLDEATRVAAETGFPLAIKAAAGGGGRGIRVVDSPDELAGAISTAQAESRAAFGSDAVYLERFIRRARHVEVQVVGDGERARHYGLRDCSVQRRRQKLVEEAGDLGLPAAEEEAIAGDAVRLAESVKYVGAGTVEFLYDAERGEHHFIEMNTRIQVEHPVTEMVHGCDLIAEQLRLADGGSLDGVEPTVARGHAIEVRINAEDPARGFFPSPGTIERLHLPGGPFVRVDSGVTTGSVVSPYYDSMLAKVVVWAPTREAAIVRMQRALGELEVEGIATTAPFVATVLAEDDFRTRTHHTTWLEQLMNERGTDGN